MTPTSHHASNAGYICTTIGVLVLTGLAGCTLETTVSLIPEEEGRVDPAFVGDWMVNNAELNDAQQLQVRDLDGRRYILGSVAEGSDHYVLRAAVLVNIAGATFVQARTLDLASTQKFEYVRVSRYSNDNFSFRALNSGFFSGDREFINAAELRSIIAANIDNPSMYREDAWVGTRKRTTQ